MKSVSKAAEMIVDYLLHADLAEAAVRRPPRSRRWVAVYTGVEPGKQVWRSTGLTGRSAALALARRWEVQARIQRAASGALTRKPTIRVRHGSAEAASGLLNQEEVAALLGIPAALHARIPGLGRLLCIRSPVVGRRTPLPAHPLRPGN